jgi:HSP20 family protein
MAGLIPFNRKNNNLIGSGFEDFYNLLDDFFTPRSLERGTFMLDVSETEKEFIIEAELPGVKKEDIQLELIDGRLTISVNREDSTEDKRGNYIHKERRLSSMRRSVYLADANPENIKAKMDNGILNITIQKEEKKINSRKIDIE